MGWQEEYESKMTTAAEAAARVKSGDRVSFTYGNDAQDLGLALASRLGELQNVTVVVPTPSRDVGWYESGWDISFDVKVRYVPPFVRKSLAEHLVDYVPGSLLWQDDGDLRPIDVLFVEISPPDHNGYCSFGASVWGKKRLMKKAMLVVGEVNERLIRTFGDNYVNVSEFDLFVPHTPSGTVPGGTDLLGRSVEGPDPVAAALAEHVAKLVDNGDTLQVGVGSASEAVVRVGALNNKVDLGWHSEVTPRGIIKLVREGVITGKRKTLHPGKVVAVAIGSTKEDMDYVHMNPMFELYDGSYVIDPRVISAHDHMIAVNSALAVDLTGQISAESVGFSMVSGTGGQLAFAVGAHLSKGGRFVTVLPAAARGGAFSRIVSTFEPGTVVSVPRTLADLVVTEFGVASLRGKSQRERVKALIAIAHPDFRRELERDAQRAFYP